MEKDLLELLTEIADLGRDIGALRAENKRLLDENAWLRGLVSAQVPKEGA